MSRNLLLHIGMPKCASTYLQRILLKNQAALSQVGMAYPHGADKRHPGNGSGFAEIDAPQLEAAFGDARTLIVSHEDLFSQGAKAASLAAAAKALNVQVHILAFIRPFSEFIFGDYSQNMKQNFDAFMKTRNPYNGRTFEVFTVLRSQSLQPAKRFRIWQDVMTVTGGHAPNFTLASHLKIKQTMIPFLNGVQMDWTLPTHEGNPSLRMEDCDRLAKRIRDTSIPAKVLDEERRAALRQAGQATGAPDAGRSDVRIAWIEAIFEKQNAELQAMYNYDNRMFRN